MNAIVPRATIETIVAARNQSLALYETAYDRMVEADEAIKEAHAMASRCSPGVNSYTYSQADEVKAFEKALALPPRDQYLRTARKLIDCNAWSYIIERTELERLMDHEAKNKLRSQMQYVPDRVDRRGQLITGEEVERGLPELTVENVTATIEHFMGDAEMIFQRGIANVFSSLDRRFRSHDGFKIGSRIILSYAVDLNSGSLRYGGRARDQLLDVERVFYVLAGEAPPSTGSIVHLIDAARSGYGPRQSETESRFIRIVIYKNGNAHLWFTDKGAVARVNKILAEYYGEVIGDGQRKKRDPFADVKHLPAKRFGFYPTPDAAADKALDGAWIVQRADKPQLRILEPSAGTGNLARRCVTTIERFRDHSGYGRDADMDRWRKEYRFDNLVDCVEIQPHLATQLQAEGIYNRVFTLDFLKLRPATTGLYDRIVMNPPFDLERDIDHVVHALKFLKPGGQLTSIMSAGTEFRETAKAVAFRELVASMGGKFTDLPDASFAEVGTYVNTCYVRLVKKEK